jgi:hypothetical protein
MKSIWNLFKSSRDAKGLDSKKTLPVWKPLGRLPRWLSKTEENNKCSRIKKVNRYLSYMERRLICLHTEYKYNKIVILWAILLKRSKSYQMVLFHRTRPDWYWKISEGDAIRCLKKFMNKCRSWNMTLELKRFYIEKSNGKLRPIGSPTYESRMISKGLNDLIYFVFENSLSSYQHAYRLERVTCTSSSIAKPANGWTSR